MRIVEVTAPALEPLTLVDAKEHLRVTATSEDAYITTLITVARRSLEVMIQRALITRSLKAYADYFPSSRVIELPFPPLVAVSALKYIVSGSTTETYTTYAAANYRVDVNSQPGRIILLDGYYWPDVWNNGDAVEISFTAGYGTGRTTIPKELIQALLLLISHWYVVRQPVITGTIVNEMPKAVEHLAMPFRCWQ